MRVDITALFVTLSLVLLPLPACSDDPAPAAASLACSLNSDCPASRACDRGVCVVLATCEDGQPCTCSSDLECPVGQLCNAVTRSCLPTECDESLDCRLGEVCMSGRCLVDTAADRDRDGVPDNVDSCPDLANPDQEDLDGDGDGDACDPDDDSDGILDVDDVCPTVPDPAQLDNDGDRLGNACDPDWAGITVTGQLVSPLRDPDWNAAHVALSGATGIHEAGPVSAGRFTITRLYPGIYALDATLPGHLALSRAIHVPAVGATLDLGPIPLTAQTDGATLTARARLGDVGPDGDHGQILVHLRAAGSLIAATLTDGAGDFAITVPRSDLELALSREGYERTTELVRWDDAPQTFLAGPTDVPLADCDGLVLAPSPTATLTGQLLSPLDGIEDWSSRAVITLFGDQSQRLEPALADGTFQLAGVRPGTWTLRVDARGHQLYVSGPIDLAAGDNAAPPITLLPEIVPVAGTVQLLTDGLPDATHADVVVRASRGETLVDTSVTDADGAFALQLTPEDHTLAFGLPNFAPVSVGVHWDADAFVLPESADAPLANTPIPLLRLATSDRDADGVIDRLDNCPTDFNPDQSNRDAARESELQGDACDPDIDQDNIPNAIDNCTFSFNPMQEDPDGDGLGIACADAANGPVNLLCGIAHQWVDTSERSNARAGSCGGASAPEVVYNVYLEAGDAVEVNVAASFGLAVYLVEVTTGGERGCALSSRATLTATRTGHHLIGIDGAGPGAVGPLTVDIQKRSCHYEPGGTLDFPVAPLPQDLVLADFDADGAVDMGIVSFQGSEAAVLRGNGDGTFGTPRSFGIDGLGSAIAAGDLDGDGVLDLAISFVRPDGVEILRGLGDGTFEPQSSFPVGRRPLGLLVDDIDLDGIPDVATANIASGTVSVLRGRGDGGFSGETRVPVGDHPLQVVLSDTTGDGVRPGRLDLPRRCVLPPRQGQRAHPVRPAHPRRRQSHSGSRRRPRP